MKNPIAMNTLVYGPSIDDRVIKSLSLIKSVGYQGIEIPIFETDLRAFHALKSEADRLGLDILTVTFTLADKNLIDPDPKVRAAGLAFLKAAIDVNVFLGSKLLCGPYQAALGKFSGAAPTQAERDLSKACLLELADYAAEKGVTLGLEYLNRFETYLVSNAEQLYDFVQDIHHPAIKIMFDTFHANIEEKNTGQAIHHIADQMPHIQLSESHRGVLGQGQVHWDTVFEALKAINYQGWLSVESFGLTLPAACIWKKTFESEEEVIVNSIQFIQEKLAKHS